MPMWCHVETLKHIERDQQGRTIHRLEDILAPSSITTPLEDIEQQSQIESKILYLKIVAAKYKPYICH